MYLRGNFWRGNGLGLVFGRTEAKESKVEKTMMLSKELHDWFKENHRSTCCRVLTKGMTLGSSTHMEQGITLTGKVAYKVAEIIVREFKE